MGRLVSKGSPTRFGPSRDITKDGRSFMADLRELEQAIATLQDEIEILKAQVLALQKA